MGTPLYTFTTKTPKQVHDDIIRTVKAILQGIVGISNPNVAPGSDFDIIATAVASEIAVGLANQTIMADQLMPDTAAGSNLDRWLTLFGLSRRGAIPAKGNVTITCSQTANIVGNPTGVGATQLVDASGQLFFVTVGGAYPNGAQVPVQAVSGGSATNHANGDTLRWVTAPPYCSQTVTVGIPNGTDGLSGGADSEVGVDEPPRNRLYQLFQNPPKGGNSQDIIGFAQQSSTSVQGCAVYPALMGPSTVFFAVWGAPQTVGPFSSTSKSRELTASLVTGTVVPYVQGSLPEYVYVVGTSTTDQPTDVSLILSLPSAPTASPPGPGGGWLDGTPWPSSTSSGTQPCTVTAVTNALTFTVNATTAPTAGATHIAYISPSNWQMYTATVVSWSGSSGAYVITTDTPWPLLATDFATGFPPAVFPQSTQQANYMAAALQGFANLGPGEWTSNAAIKARAFRHPPPSLAWPSTLNALFLRQMENAGPEVANAQFIVGANATPTVPSSITVNASGVLTSTPPATLIPRNLSWYAS
jgi:uncharacterized phage protein gp47/JayE